MKPIELLIQAFGPYADRQVIDFEKLAQKGMFLIKGPTGSGKTTIFDAMTFALYGGSSGEDTKSKVGRNDLEQWRCNQAPEKLSTEITFTFSVQGRKYRFTRALEPKRKNLSAKYAAGELTEDGILIPFFENPKKDDLTHKAEELIGLTKEQFRQVVLLPQGQFERFLVAPSTEKEEILKKIFDSQRWEDYTARFFDAASRRKSALDEEKKAIALSLSEENVENLNQLAERITSLEAERRENEEAYQAFDASGRQALLNADIQLSEQFRPLHEAETLLSQLLAQEGEMKSRQETYLRAKKAENLRPVLAKYEQTQEELQRRSREADTCRSQLPAAQTRLTAALEAKQNHEANSPVAQWQGKIGEYESKRSLYARQRELTDAFAAADKLWKQSRQADELAQNALTQAVHKASSDYAAFQLSEKTARDYRTRYYAGIYGELAAQLTENAPCPVCGSPHHPAPAHRAQDSITKTQLDQQETLSRKADSIWKQSETAREQAQARRDTAARELAKAETDRAQAEAEWKHAQASLIPGIRDAAALDAALRKLRQNIEAYETQSRTLQIQYQSANENLVGLNAKAESLNRELENARQEAAAALEALHTALTQCGYPDAQSAEADLLPEETRNQLYDTLVKYKQARDAAGQTLTQRQEALSGKQEPDISHFRQRQQEIETANAGYNSKKTELDTKIQRLTRKQQDLQKKAAHFDSEIREAEDDLAFARKLRGDTGIGLQRYVLAILFNQVIGEANRMLEKVHAGRYRLYRSDEKGAGNKRGLELKVRDSRSIEQEGRSVAMLSGGEKFLVSLSLSIGMSTVAQKTGVQIEALFIDEGFGTLDDSSIHDAMDILESVRRSNGMIGIISHVRLLESNVPTHLEVVKTSSGSNILRI